jgi:hypothetical protein
MIISMCANIHINKHLKLEYPDDRTKYYGIFDDAMILLFLEFF